MTDSRFAERTRVPVAQSQTEVKTLLKIAGSDKIAVYEDTEKSAVAFRMKDRFYRITVPVRAKARNPGQEERRSWRLVLLLIKAKLEATTFEREFLADMVTPDGSTVSEWIAEPLRLAYESGRMPDQLLLGG
jgi:hypothetical protein